MGREIDVQIVPKAGMVNVTVDGRAGGGSRDAVKYTPQDLTDEQKAQARENIGAVSMVDLNQRVQVVDVNDIVSLQDTNLILVMSEEDGKVAEILPSGQAEEYGWLYDWQEGWRVADIAGFTYFGRTWLDLLQYMEEHSTPLSILSNGVVRHDIAQTLTPAQQTQARNNIDAASKAQVTRIALNVGYTDKIKDTATTMRELSERVSIINVLDGDIIAGCILPSSQTGTIGWLYEFEEGWMLTKDISGYVIGEHTWEDLLWYLDANSGKIVNAIRLGLVTGDLSQLTTADKSTLVAAINEVNADKASSAALTAEVTRATAAEGALAGEIGDLSSLQTTAKDNLVNAINEVAQGGGGSSEWEQLIDNTTDTGIAQWKFAQGQGGQTFNDYKELLIYIIIQPRTDGGTGNTKIRANLNSGSAWVGYAGYEMLSNTSSTATMYALMHFVKTPYGILSYPWQSANTGSVSAYFSNYGTALYPIMGVLANNQVHPSTEDNMMHDFNQVCVGSYQTVIGAGSRIQVYGRK